MTRTGPGAVIQQKILKPASVYREAIHPSTIEPDGMGTMLNEKYDLNLKFAALHGWGQTGKTLVMPVLSPFGNVRGHVTRTFDKPKRCYTYKATAQPWLDHWRATASSATDSVVVVEDCLSACRLAGLGYTSVALLGTSMSVPQAQEIAEYDKPTYLALDRDAFAKAIKLQARLAHICEFMVVCLDEDIKNVEDDADIHNTFGGCNGGGLTDSFRLQN